MLHENRYTTFTCLLYPYFGLYRSIPLDYSISMNLICKASTFKSSHAKGLAKVAPLLKSEITRVKVRSLRPEGRALDGKVSLQVYLIRWFYYGACVKRRGCEYAHRRASNMRHICGVFPQERNNERSEG